MHQIRQQLGITLIELLVTLAVLGILTFYAAPFFQSVLSQKDLNTAKNTLVHSINKAKRIASAENTFVDLQLNNNQILLTRQNTGQTETYRLPQNIVFPATKNLTFNANGIIVSTGENGIESDTSITLQHKNHSAWQEAIRLSTTGLVAEL